MADVASRVTIRALELVADGGAEETGQLAGSSSCVTGYMPNGIGCCNYRSALVNAQKVIARVALEHSISRTLGGKLE